MRLAKISPLFLVIFGKVSREKNSESDQSCVELKTVKIDRAILKELSVIKTSEKNP